MAKIGLNNFRYSILTEASDGTPSYNGAKKPAKAVSCSVSITNNSASLYADDTLAESDTSFQSGTVAMGIDDEDTQTMAELLGHDYNETTGEMVRNANDMAPYVALGRVITKMVGGQYKYKAEFLYKVKFSEPSQDDTTKGESVEFATSTINGVVSTLADGNWSRTETFDSKAEAISYIEGLMAQSTTATLTYNANGGSNPPEAVNTYIGAEVTLDDGSGLTAPTGKHFIGWDTTSTATIPDCHSPYRVNGNITLYAIYENDEA